MLDALTYAGNEASLAPVRDDIEFVQGSVADAELVDRLVARHDVVVHFAGREPQRQLAQGPVAVPADHRRDVHDPGGGPEARRAAAHLHRRGLRRPRTRRSGQVHAGDPYNPSSPYSSTKAGSDLLVRAWVRSFGITATISNCSNNYGPYQHIEKFIPRQITNVLAGLRPKLYGAGENVRDWIHVDDHNSAVHAILEGGRSGETYLIGADGEQNNREVLSLILELLGQPGTPTSRSPTGRARPALRHRREQAPRRARLEPGSPTSRTAWPPPSTGTATTRRGGAR